MQDNSYLWAKGQDIGQLEDAIFADYLRDLVEGQPRCVKMGGFIPISIMTSLELTDYAKGTENRERTIVVSFNHGNYVSFDPKVCTAGNGILEILWLTVSGSGWDNLSAMGDGPISLLQAKTVAQWVCKHICQTDFDRLIIQGEDALGLMPTYYLNSYMSAIGHREEFGNRGLSRASAIAAALVCHFGYSPRHYFLDRAQAPHLGIYAQMLNALAGVDAPEQERAVLLGAKNTLERYQHEVESGQRPPVRATWTVSGPERDRNSEKGPM